MNTLCLRINLEHKYAEVLRQHMEEYLYMQNFISHHNYFPNWSITPDNMYRKIFDRLTPNAEPKLDPHSTSLFMSG